MIFTLDQAMRTQSMMRQKLGLDEVTFELPEFVGMLSDEIEAMREAGQDDAAIARMISDETGQAVAADAIARHYNPPENRY